MPSDTHTDELRKQVDELIGYNEHDNCGEECREKTYRVERVNVLVDLTRQRERAAQLALIERLRKHGHGGGNWRRLLDEEAKKLEE